MMNHPRIVHIEDYHPLIGAEAVERILKKAKPLRDLHVVNVNSTYYGGGVAELLGSMTILMNSAGIKTGWRVIQGSPDFFSITKKMHNALQGGEINLTDRKKEIFEEVVYENTIRTHLDHDLVIIHDPQPLPMINHYRKRGPWIWRGHVDLSRPNRELWEYLSPFIEKYDAVIFSIREYAQKLKTPQRFFLPAIDPSPSKTILSTRPKSRNGWRTIIFPPICRWWCRSPGLISGKTRRGWWKPSKSPGRKWTAPWYCWAT
jgi:trehalose synthase